jgi:hypothetical protein
MAKGDLKHKTASYVIHIVSDVPGELEIALLTVNLYMLRGAVLPNLTWTLE